MTEAAVQDVLEVLGVRVRNPGACTGPWIDTTGQELESVNPTKPFSF